MSVRVDWAALASAAWTEIVHAAGWAALFVVVFFAAIGGGLGLIVLVHAPYPLRISVVAAVVLVLMVRQVRGAARTVARILAEERAE